MLIRSDLRVVEGKGETCHSWGRYDLSVSLRALAHVKGKGFHLLIYGIQQLIVNIIGNTNSRKAGYAPASFS